MNTNFDFYNDIRIISITSTTTATLIGKHIATVLAGKSQSLPSGAILKMNLRPSADVTIQDIKTGDEITVTNGSTKEYPVLNAHDKLLVKGTATVLVELYFGN